MAITVVGSAYETGSTVSSKTKTYSAIGGSNNYIIVALFKLNHSAPSSVTYGGVAMTQLAHQDATSYSCLYLFGIAASNTGNNDVVVTYSGNQTFHFHIIEISTVKSAGNTASGFTDSGWTKSINITSPAPDLIIGAAMTWVNATLNAIAGQTQIIQQSIASNFSAQTFYKSGEGITGITATRSSALDWITIVGVEFSEATGGVTAVYLSDYGVM